MEYLYNRRKELQEKINKLMPRCFNKEVKVVLKELQARLDELNKAIREIEHE